jgi:hypothetical protein
MSSEISLKSLEKKIFQTTLHDGILEIMLGSGTLMLSIAPPLSVYLGDFWASAVFLPFWAGIYLIIRLVRKRIIQPRVGIIKPGAYRKRRLKRMNLVMLVFNVVALILGVTSFLNFSQLPSWIIPARFSVVILIGFSLTAYMVEYPKLFLYGVICSLAIWIGEILSNQYQIPHHGLPLTFGIISGAFVLIGVFTIWKIYKNNPIPPQDVMND